MLVAPEPDRQQPHADDEVYVVLEGRGVLSIEGGETSSSPQGHAAFLPAGADHGFTGYEGLSVLVIFSRPHDRAARSAIVPYALPALDLPRRDLRGLQTHARVDGNSRRPGDHRVQVELGNLGQVLGEPREPVEEVVSAPVSAAAHPEARQAFRLLPVISSSASTSVSGAIRKPASPISSARTPPGPNATSGPKVGSWTIPARSSTPPGSSAGRSRAGRSVRRPRGLHHRRRGRVPLPRSRSCARPGAADLTTAGSRARWPPRRAVEVSATRSPTSGIP